MDLGLRGRVAAVAAASKGLGFACAEALAGEGASVAICGRDAEQVADAAARLGPDAHGVALDLTDGDACERFIEQTVERFGRLDVVVCNNGGPPPATASGASIEQYRAALDATLMTTTRLALTALPHMRHAGWGRIIAITSSAAKQPITELALSDTARAGVLGFLKALSNEVAAEGITVNAVAPGTFLTDRIRTLAGDDDDAIAAMGASTPVGRLGDPAEFGAVVAFLASEQASYLTGANIAVDGGAVRSI